MKKKIIIISVIILLLLLFPIKLVLNDGGTVEYKAILYTVTKYNRIDGILDDGSTKYITGTGVKILGFEAYKNTEEIIDKHHATNENTTGNVNIALTLKDEIEKDTIWCGTFQLIWNDLKNDLAKQDIEFTPQLEVVENLNKETFTVDDISEEAYYKTYGHPTIELKEEIERAIKEKFNETSDILDDFDWSDNYTENYFLYVMLKKEFEFEYQFDELEDGNFGDYENIKYFGIEEDDEEVLGNQVRVLYYNSNDDFAIKLLTKQNDEVIICKNPEGNTFDDIYNKIIEQEENYTGEMYIQEGEKLKIPNISVKRKERIAEVENKPFLFSDGREYFISQALQTIEFDLDKSGGRIKSEAGIMMKESIEIATEEKREFYVDDTFALFLIESGKDTPYFASLIDDITKFQ